MHGPYFSYDSLEKNSTTLLKKTCALICDFIWQLHTHESRGKRIVSSWGHQTC